MVKKRFNLVYILLAFVCFLVALVPFFASKSVTVKADTVTEQYVYTGSSLFVPYWNDNYVTNDDTDSKGFLDFRVDIYPTNYDPNKLNIKLYISKIYEEAYAPTQFGKFVVRPLQGAWHTLQPMVNATPNCSQVLSFNNVLEVGSTGVKSLGTRYWVGDVNFDPSIDGSREFSQMYISCSYHSFKPSITTITVGSFPVSELTGDTTVYNSGTEHYDFINYIRYTDINDNWIQFSFPTKSGASILGYWTSKPIVFTERVYYTNLFFNSDGLYKKGLSEGYQNGLKDYQNSSEYFDALMSRYTDGYKRGSADGFARGSALLDEEYNFTTAVSTLIGAPIDITARMLNFNVLGINLWALVGGLFTLLLIIKIIRIFV